MIQPNQMAGIAEALLILLLFFAVALEALIKAWFRTIHDWWVFHDRDFIRLFSFWIRRMFRYLWKR